MKNKNPFVIVSFIFFSLITSCSGNYNSKTESGVTIPTYAFDTATPEPQFVNINPAISQEYIANPGMGWQKDFSSYSDHFPETVAYGNRLNLTWSRLNPAEGIYAWEILDEEFNQAIIDGKQFSFRVITMAGEIYGGHHVPQWVIDKGANIFSYEQEGYTIEEPDYSNCVYQEEWGNFVNALLARYDGNPNIAYIDISGYGNFNEWSWTDIQTEWDDYFDPNLANFTIATVDGQARKRLVDMFAGGSFENHKCRDVNGNIQTTAYHYAGAQKTQLIMPFAGIIQSTQYVHAKRQDIGFRFDCLGRGDDLPTEVISAISLNAPIVYELCGPTQFDVSAAHETIITTHPILIHNNDYNDTTENLEALITPIGYRLFLKEATANYAINSGEELTLNMIWQNLGTAQVYPKLGQNFELHVYLLEDTTNGVQLDCKIETDISKWMPAEALTISPAPEYSIESNIPIPASMPKGIYWVAISIINTRTGAPIALAMDGEYMNGKFVLFKVKVQ
jgi:hypothetical protein